MDISFYEFSNLPDEIQYSIVLDKGRIINDSINNGSRYVLYALSTFSVELIYNVSRDKISGKNIYLNRAAYAF